MALSKSQLQKLWRARRDLKAKFFEDQDSERAYRLYFPESFTSTPEGAALESFFRNYPKCYIAPTGLRLTDGAWVVSFGTHHIHVLTEAAAAIVALREVSSVPVLIRTSDMAAPMVPFKVVDLVSEIADDVRDMRTARMWGAR